MIDPKHACGMCDGRLRYDGMMGKYPTFVCTVCSQWHIAKDCCEDPPKSTNNFPY